MGKQKVKKGPAHKLPRRRNTEAQSLEAPQFRPRIVREKNPHVGAERCPDCGAPLSSTGLCGCWFV